MAAVRLEPGWLEVLAGEFEMPYMIGLKQFLQDEKVAGKKVYPPGPLIFNALNLTPFDEVRVVILGQDPYHGHGQAHGLSFSVPPGVAMPPSLRNIYNELQDDLGIKPPVSGDLTNWARQGILLLNAILTVQASQAGSHQKKGWEQFTDAIINQLNAKRNGLVFVLWGAYARSKKALIDTSRHDIVESAHPSPFSANYGFLGSRPFSKINALLSQRGLPVINWDPAASTPA